MANGSAPNRGEWGSRIGFVLAAAGSAVGLGNIWKFPYITGLNGGGIFVLIYLVCIAVIGLPIMIAEIGVGRRAQASPIIAYAKLSGDQIAWKIVGAMAVLTGFVLLSYYSVVGGWTAHYIVESLRGAFEGQSVEQIGAQFESLSSGFATQAMWHTVFMAICVSIVFFGVHRGIEICSRILMPLLFVLLTVLLITAIGQSGFGDAMDFVFSPSTDNVTPGGVLEALGHSFFTLSLGSGAIITYGSYIRAKDDIVATSATISVLDTTVALVSCAIMFPIIFSYGMEPGGGPGLVFVSMPVAFSQMTGGLVVAVLFFVLLLFAAVTSGISLLEVTVSSAYDLFGISRKKASIGVGLGCYAIGLVCVASFAGHMGWWQEIFGDGVFTTLDNLVSRILLPLGGLAIAVFVGWFVKPEVSREEFTRGSRFPGLYPGWLLLLRFVVPAAILLIVLYSIKVIPEDWLK